MLPKVTHQANSSDRWVLLRQAFNFCPAVVWTAVIDQDYFIGGEQRRQRLLEPVAQLLNGISSVVNWNHD